jgi:protease I
MAQQTLKGFTIAVVATASFEQSELLVPGKSLTAAVPPRQGALRGWNHKAWANDEVPLGLTLDQTDPQDVNAPVLAGGVRTDIEIAGAHWVDEEGVVEGNLVTSRKPDDQPAFNREILQLFEQLRSKSGGRDRAHVAVSPGPAGARAIGAGNAPVTSIPHCLVRHRHGAVVRHRRGRHWDSGQSPLSAAHDFRSRRRHRPGAVLPQLTAVSRYRLRCFRRFEPASRWGCAAVDRPPASSWVSASCSD